MQDSPLPTHLRFVQGDGLSVMFKLNGSSMAVRAVINGSSDDWVEAEAPLKPHDADILHRWLGQYLKHLKA